MMLDFWFQFAVTIFKGVLAGLHLDPSKLPALKNILLGVATDIFILYGLVPPTGIVQMATEKPVLPAPVTVMPSPVAAAIPPATVTEAKLAEEERPATPTGSVTGHPLGL